MFIRFLGMAKKQSFFRKGTAIFIIVIFIATLFVYHKQMIRLGYKAWRYQKRIFNKTTSVGNRIDYPEGYKIHGIDVSRWQPDINWESLRAVNLEGDTIRFAFAFIKATEGILLEDPMFRDNWEAARKNNITRGAYHYFLPSLDATLQAKNFISSVNLAKGDLPPVVDVEEKGRLTRKELVKKLKVFIALIEKEYKVKPILYSNISFIEDYLADDFPDYDFWIAHYYETELKVEKSINWVFWQHSDRAGIINSPGTYDANVFNGSKEDFRKILIR